MKAANDDMSGPYADIFSADTRDLMGFFVTLRKLLGACGIHDFSLQDLYKPTHPRLVKHFSHIINFVRFRESQTNLIDEHYKKSEGTKERIESLYAENQDKEDMLSNLEHNRQAAEAAIKSKTGRSNELKERLLELKRDQERVAIKVERMKEEQARLKALLEDRTEQTMNVRQDADKLRPYTTQSPAMLENSLRDMSSNVNNDKAQIEALDRRARALQTSCDAFNTVTADIKTCFNLLNELGRDLAAEESTASSATRNRDALSERSNNVRDVERHERMLQKQLENVQRRTEKLRVTAEERRDAEGRKMEELKKVNESIRKERGDRGREMERRRVRIEQTEKKMADLKENIENEIQAAREEYVKMDSHIRLYVKEMEQSIS
ncbi:hypothetical protein FH972_022433 [Carpinus fangiana]|uniref:Uncharacterized protein n=1 Tax=Carpinus fangiana TaxID=176857 RepID=A0A5N6KSS4_9ROSI|nr:hypothetical protein FH972_022433 [Carpinus fangiana]